MLLALIWYAAFHVGVSEHADGAVFRAFTDLRRPRVDHVAAFLVGLCNPKPYVCLCAVVLLLALARRRVSVAVAIAAILLAANVTTQLLKVLLSQPRYSLVAGGVASSPAGSWPSGHSTAAMSLALCSVLAAPSILRPLVAPIGGGFAVAVGYSLLTLGAHFPSDVLAGFLVAATWTMLAIAALSVLGTRRSRREDPRTVGRVSVRAALAPGAAALLAALLLALVAVVARPHDVVAYAGREALVVGAAAIATIGVAVATGVMLALRR